MLSIKSGLTPVCSATHYTIFSDRLPRSFDGFRIAHLSDLHGMLYGKGNCELIRKIHEEKPDIVVMTGDMADHGKFAVSRALNLCRRLRKRYPVYYVVGNHEQTLEGNILGGLIRELRAEGVVVLDNQWCELVGKEVMQSDCVQHEMNAKPQRIRLYGLVTPMVYYKDPLGEYQRGAHFTEEDTRECLGKPDSSVYNILLAHNPLYFPSYRDWGADLTLSGHVHGGIIRLPFIGGVLSPELKFFPKYDGGIYMEKGKYLVVSRGLGNRFLMRVNNRAELVIAELKREDVPCINRKRMQDGRRRKKGTA